MSREDSQLSPVVTKDLVNSCEALVHLVGNVSVYIALQSHANSCVEVGFLHSGSQFSLASDQAVECPPEGSSPSHLVIPAHSSTSLAQSSDRVESTIAGRSCCCCRHPWVLSLTFKSTSDSLQSHWLYLHPRAIRLYQ